MRLTLNLLTTTKVAPPSNASNWQKGFNSAFKGLTHLVQISMRSKVRADELGKFISLKVKWPERECGGSRPRGFDIHPKLFKFSPSDF